MNIYEYKDNSLYRDRYERNKKWVKVLFRPGRPLQSSELIELQSIILDQQKQVLNSIYRSGSILSGLDVYIKEDNDSSLSLMVEGGSLYIEGYVIDIKSRELSIPKEGLFSIGVLIKEYIIDEKDDSSLRLGGTSYGIEGASRLIWEGSITLNDNISIEIARVEDGNIIQPYSNRKSKVEEQLISYLRDKDGSFIINGMEVSHVESIKPAYTVNALDMKKEEILKEKNEKVKELEGKLIDIDTRISNLRLKLTQDTNALNIEPTPINLSKVQNTLKEIETLTTTQDLLKEQLNSSKLELAESLSININPSKLDKEVFSVSPGLAYIEGVRVLLTTSKSISIPKSLETKSVEGVKFLYNSSFISFSSTLIGYDLPSSINESILLSIKGINISPIYLSFNINTDYLSIDNLLVSFVDSLINKESLKPITQDKDLLNKINNYLTFKIGANNLLIIEGKEVLGVEPIEINITTTNTNKLKWDISYGIVKRSIVSNIYQLDNKDIVTVSNFIADLKEEKWQVSRSNNGVNRDYLGEDSIYKILNVFDNDVLYKQGVDYILEGQSHILWLNTNNKPNEGSTYFVDYIYTDRLVKDIDFSINSSNGTIVFIGRTPAPGYTFSLDYTYSIPKSIYVYINSSSSISYSNNLISSLDNSSLLLARVIIYSQKIEVYPVDNKALTSKELYYLNKNLKENMRLLSQLELDIDTYNDIQEYGIDEPIGSFSDAIDDLSRIDLNKSSFSIAPNSRSISTFIKNKVVKVKYISGGIAHYPTQYQDRINYISLPFSTTNVINQSRATRYRNIRPLVNKNVYRGRIYLDKDIYESSSSYIYPGEVISIDNLKGSFKTSYDHNKTFIYSPIYENLKLSLLSNYYTMDETLSSFSTWGINKRNSLDIEVIVEGLLPNEDNLNIYLNNIKLDIEEQVIGVFNGTIRGLLGIKTNPSGTIHIKIRLFDIPIGSNLLEVKGIYSYASTSFILADIPLIKYLNHLYKERIPFNQSYRSINLPYQGDNQYKLPSIIQEFRVEKEMFITDIVVRFRQIGEGRVDLDIREEGSNGLVSNDVLVTAKAIDDVYWYDEFGTQSTIFNLDYPLHIKPYKKYYITLTSNSNGFDIFTSQIGEKDLLDGNRIGSQLLNAGGLYISINGTTLSKYQDEDLSYVIKGGLFKGNQMELIDLGKYTVDVLGDVANISHFSYFSKDIIPIGTDIKYQYRTSINTQWKDFNPNEYVYLSNLVSFIELRAFIINGTINENSLTPLLDINNSYVVLSSPTNHGVVKYKTINYPEPYENVRVILEGYEPPGTLIRVFIGDRELRRESSTPIDNYPSMETISYTLNNLNTSTFDITISLFSADSPGIIPFFRNFKSYVW